MCVTARDNRTLAFVVIHTPEQSRKNFAVAEALARERIYKSLAALCNTNAERRGGGKFAFSPSFRIDERLTCTFEGIALPLKLVCAMDWEREDEMN
jgi:hypothetical protein